MVSVLDKGQNQKPQGVATMNEEYLIEQQLFEMIGGKPKGYLKTKVINVYGNRYRVNVYANYTDPVYDIEKTKIAVSCFGRLDDDEFIVTYPANFSGLAV